MNWKVEVISLITLILQTALLFASWWFKWLVEDSNFLPISIGVAVLGLVGGCMLLYFKNNIIKAQTKYNWVARLGWGIVGGVGIYFIFLPALVIINSASIATVILLLGLFAPWLCKLAIMPVLKNS